MSFLVSLYFLLFENVWFIFLISVFALNFLIITVCTCQRQDSGKSLPVVKTNSFFKSSWLAVLQESHKKYVHQSLVRQNLLKCFYKKYKLLHSTTKVVSSKLLFYCVFQIHKIVSVHFIKFQKSSFSFYFSYLKGLFSNVHLVFTLV